MSASSSKGRHRKTGEARESVRGCLFRELRIGNLPPWAEAVLGEGRPRQRRQAHRASAHPPRSKIFYGKGVPSIVRDFLLQSGISFYSKGFPHFGGSDSATQSRITHQAPRSLNWSSQKNAAAVDHGLHMAGSKVKASAPRPGRTCLCWMCVCLLYVLVAALLVCSPPRSKK